MAKQMILIPIYWGDWWVPARGNSYNWLDVNGLMTRVVEGRYMDGLNQYEIERGTVSKTHVVQQDPPATGFGDAQFQAIFRQAIDDGNVPRPDDFDLVTQLPFYSLLVKPGVEHLRDATSDGTVAQNTPDVNTGAYHFGFTYRYVDARHDWHGQACWVKSDTSADGTVARWVHEMAEAYSGHSEVADQCQNGPRVLVDGVSVPQYWSEAEGTCWPPSDTAVTVEVALERDRQRAGPQVSETIEVALNRDRSRRGSPVSEPIDQSRRDGPHISG